MKTKGDFEKLTKKGTRHVGKWEPEKWINYDKGGVAVVTHFKLAHGMFPIDELPPPVDLQSVVLGLLSQCGKDCGLLLQGAPHQSHGEVLRVLLHHEAFLWKRYINTNKSNTTAENHTVQLSCQELLPVRDVLSEVFLVCQRDFQRFSRLLKIILWLVLTF